MKDIEIENRLKSSVKRALLGNSNTSIRAIAVATNGTKLIVKCYINRIPTEDDFESLSDISGEIISDFDYDELEEICEFSTMSISELEQIKDMVVVIPHPGASMQR